MSSIASTITLGDVQISGKGAKSIPVYGADGKPIYLFPSSMSVPFNASSYNNIEANRITLSFTPTDELIEQIRDIEKEVKNQLSSRLPELFGSQSATLEKQDEWFQSVIKTNKGYQTMKTKIDLTGKYQTRVWSIRREPLPLPSDWSDHNVKPKLWVRSIWIMGKECGLVIDCQDAQLEEIKRICPF